MKKFLRYLAILLTLLAIASGTVYYFFPSVIVHYQIQSIINKNGIIEKIIPAGNHLWSYYEAGEKNQNTVLLLHGYGVSKIDWLGYLIPLKNRYHVIAPDLPGFGKTKADLNFVYDSKNYSELLHHFIESKQLKNIQIIGLSMGGFIAGAYASYYPESVKSLIMIDPGGIQTIQKTPYWKKYIETGINDLDYKNMAQFHSMTALIYHKTIPIPFYVKNFAVREKNKNYEIQSKIFNDLFKKNPDPLGERLSQIQCQSLILWGEKDQIFHVSSVERIQIHLKKSEIHILEEAGHVPIVEASKESYQLITDFLEKNQIK